MASNGVNIVAVSVQNEPELSEPYDSCLYSAAELDSFIGGYMGPTFASNGITATIMMPETVDLGRFDRLRRYDVE